MLSLPLWATSFVGRRAAWAPGFAGTAIRGQTDRFKDWVEHVS